MKIIGHRGAAGIALENTIESIKAAVSVGVDAIEFDIRLTADGTFVLMHDDTMERVSNHKHAIQDIDEKHLETITLHNGEKLPTLSEAIVAAAEVPVVIEPKGSGWAIALSLFLDNHKTLDASVIAYNHRELGKFSKLQTTIPTYSIEHTRPFDAIQLAKQNGFTGVDMNFWILNPLTYYMARRKKLQIIVYTVNYRWIAWFLKLLFPKVMLTTDNPHLMQFVRPRSKRPQNDRVNS